MIKKKLIIECALKYNKLIVLLRLRTDTQKTGRVSKPVQSVCERLLQRPVEGRAEHGLSTLSPPANDSVPEEKAAPLAPSPTHPHSLLSSAPAQSAQLAKTGSVHTHTVL